MSDLKIVKSAQSKRRNKLGSVYNTEDAFDGVSEVNIAVESFDLNLKLQTRSYTLYQHQLPQHISAYLFADKPTNLSEAQFRINSIEFIENLDHKVLNEASYTQGRCDKIVKHFQHDIIMRIGLSTEAWSYNVIKRMG